MKNITTLMFSLFIGVITSQAQVYQWSKSIGSTNSDEGNSIAVDNFGNIYTTGYFQGTADFDPGTGTFNLTSTGSTDIFISKLDPSGNFIWAKSIGGSSQDWSSFITIDTYGNVYTTGYFQGTVDFDPGAGTSNLTSAGSSDIFISKIDTAGNFIWAKSISGSAWIEGRSISIDATGNIFVTGSFLGTADFDPGTGTSNLTSSGGSDIFILKLDSGGNFSWAKSIGDSAGGDAGNSIAVDASGNVYTGGYFQGTVDFNPGAGTFNLTSSGPSHDIFITKLDASGNFIWAKSMGGSGGDFARFIAVEDYGNVYITGNFVGTADFDPGPGINNLTSVGSSDIFISKLDSAGNFSWAKNIGGTNYDIGYSIALDTSNNVYTTGYFWETVDFDPGAGTTNLTSVGEGDIFISKLDTAGNFIWANSFGGANNDYGTSITVDGLGNIYTTGFFEGTADFDPSSGTSNLASLGQSDIFISKLKTTSLGLFENNFENRLTGYPNPTNGEVKIHLDKSYDEVTVIIKNQLGQDVMKKSHSGSNFLQINIPGESGMYYILVSSGNKKAILKIVKE